MACANKDMGINWSNLVYKIGETVDSKQMARAECLRLRDLDLRLFNPFARRILPCPCTRSQARRDRRYRHISFINDYDENVQIPPDCWAPRFGIFGTGFNLCCYGFGYETSPNYVL